MDDIIRTEVENENRFRVCHVQVLPIMSGVQRAMIDMLRFLDTNRYEAHVVCREEGPLTEELQRIGLPFHTVPALDRPIHPSRDLQAYLQLRKLFHQHNFSLVHTHSSKPGVLARLAASQVRVPRIVHHVHGFAFHEFSSKVKAFAYSRTERFAGRYCDCVVFVNHEEREMAIQHGWLPADKCVTIPNGVDLSNYGTLQRRTLGSAFRKRHGIDAQTVVILFTARLDEQKQPLILPEIAKRLRTLSPASNWRLLVQGDGLLEPRVRALVEEMELQDQVLMLGWQADPTHGFHAADIVLHPTLWEGLPLSLLEAQAASLPIVASNVKGNREVVTPDTGFLCDPRNVDQYVAALAQLINNPAHRHHLGTAGRRRAERYFDTRITSRQVGDLYDELLELPKSDPAQRSAA